MENSSVGSASQQASTSSDSVDMNAETTMNLALLDPPRWGWSAAGGIVDMLPPHERARRTSAQEAYVRQLRRKERMEARKKKEETDAVLPGNPHFAPMMGTQHSVSPSSDGKMPAVDDATIITGNGLGPFVAEQCTNGPGDAASWATLTAQGNTLRAVTVDESVAILHSEITLSTRDIPEKIIHSQLYHKNSSSEPILARLGQAMNTDVASIPTPDRRAAFDMQSTSKKESNRIIEVKALDENGVLDMYTYHRGREGEEPRDEETGQLLCDVDPTDSNYGWDPPSLTIMINVVFPLTDNNDASNDKGDSKVDDGHDSADSHEKKGCAPRSRHESGPEVYRETIEWDLADPRTLTPLCFATGVGEDFGLNAWQTLDLAESIQKQINDFVQNKVSYRMPLTLNDYDGNERLYPVNMGGPPQLFGSAIGEIKAGMTIPSEKRQQSISVGLAVGRDRGTNWRSAATEVEGEYRIEALRRAREGSIRDIEAKSRELLKDGVVGALRKEADYVCHACHARKRQCRKFACNLPTHALCDDHITSMIGISIDSSDTAPICVDFCPICSLMCGCKKCTKRLADVSNTLKHKCIEQDKPPEEVSFDDFFEKCSSDRSSTKERRRSRNYENGVEMQVKMVPKVPAHEFPREVSGGRDLDPGTNEDYRTVFTAEGTFIQNDLPRAPGNSEPTASGEGAVEDGNVDYCHTCQLAGNLLCCDVCPRAFHRECIPSAKPTEGDWECFVCRKEKEVTEDDVVTGISSLDVVCAPFVGFKHSTGFNSSLQVLSMIHEMVLKLMDYDFGFLFREPVDCQSVPGYSALVKKPMDLGTIGAKLIKGDYVEHFHRSLSWDDVLVATLQDVELVWHNCFTFNYEGSAIYRMAEVQRRKYHKIRKRSIDHLLSDEAKQRIVEYASERENERNNMVRVTKDASVPSVLERRASNGRNKITVPFSKGGTNRLVAVLDPETGLPVKIYSSLKSSCLAALFLVGLGYPVEFPDLAEKNVTSIIRKSPQDPTLLLFGYRWLDMDDLVRRKVKFGTQVSPADVDKAEPSGLIAMTKGDDTCLFLSVEEAVSRPELPEGVSVASMRQILSETPFGESKAIGGFSWKRLESEGTDATHTKQGCLISNDKSSDPVPANVMFVKEDLLSQRVLVGFESARSAHLDWLTTLEGSPVFPVDEPTDFEYFLSYYLDGERNIDGMIWRTSKVSQPHQVDDSSPAPQDLAQSSGPNHPSESTTLPELENGIDAHNMGAQTEQTSTNGKELNETIDAQSYAPGTDSVLQNTAILGNANGRYSPLVSKNGTKANGDRQGIKRGRDDECLEHGRTIEKTVICSNQ